jgi:hypothetical protein
MVRDNVQMKPISKEFAVRREAIQNFFDPPIAKSTFFDLVARGKVAKVKELRGYYRLNESLQRLGLSAVDQLPAWGRDDLDPRALADIALALCMPGELPMPSELLAHALTADEVLLVARLQRSYKAELVNIHAAEERLNFAQGVRDAALMLSSERQS